MELPVSAIEAIDKALKAAGVKYDACLVLVKAINTESPSGYTIVTGYTGDTPSLYVMLSGTLQRIIAEPVTLQPLHEDLAGQPRRQGTVQ